MTIVLKRDMYETKSIRKKKHNTTTSDKYSREKRYKNDRKGSKKDIGFPIYFGYISG